MSRKAKAAIPILLLIVGVAILFFGIWRKETVSVLGKATKLCLECVGIG